MAKHAAIRLGSGAMARGPFGGLIASGRQTTSLAMHVYSEHYLPSAAVTAPPVVDELRWLKPVRPDDRLWIRMSTISSLRSGPGPGMLRVRIEVVRQNQETVMSLIITNLLRCRPPS